MTCETAFSTTTSIKTPPNVGLSYGGMVFHPSSSISDIYTCAAVQAAHGDHFSKRYSHLMF